MRAATRSEYFEHLMTVPVPEGRFERWVHVWTSRFPSDSAAGGGFRYYEEDGRRFDINGLLARINDNAIVTGT